MNITLVCRAKQITESQSMLLSTPSKLEEMTGEACAAGSRLDLKRRFEAAAAIITGKDEK